MTQPSLAASLLEGWPRSIPAPARGAPPGYRANRALSSFAGVTGFSSADAAAAVLRVGASTARLPPPFALLYSGNPLPVDKLAGGEVRRLDGGVIPLYAARAADGDGEVWGMAFTVEGAKLALAAGLSR